MGSWWWFVQPIQLTTIIDYQGGTNAIYVGETQPSTGISSATLQGQQVWRIKKITYDGNGNATNVQWSPNTNSFGDIWSNRTGLTYS
jgi:hypothetical protein